MLIILLFFSLNIIKHYIFIYLLGPVQDARRFARRVFNAAERVVSVDPGIPVNQIVPVFRWSEFTGSSSLQHHILIN